MLVSDCRHTKKEAPIYDIIYIDGIFLFMYKKKNREA